MRRSTFRTAAVTLVTAAGAAALGTAAVVYGGLYDVAADTPHTQPVFTLMETTLRHSVRRRAAVLDEPPFSAAAAERGAACYFAHCAACHGAPGIAPAAPGLAMQPLPGPLVDAARHWRPRELLWITRHGIRMSGMPAWGGRLADDDQWAIVAWLQMLPQLSPREARLARERAADVRCVLLGEEDAAVPAAPLPVAGGDAAERGRRAMHRHGCNGCHTIPGVVGGQRHVGPPLAGFAQRTLIAGRLPNTPAQLVRWIRSPQHVDPATAMVTRGIGEHDAAAMAAYLALLR